MSFITFLKDIVIFYLLLLSTVYLRPTSRLHPNYKEFFTIFSSMNVFFKAIHIKKNSVVYNL